MFREQDKGSKTTDPNHSLMTMGKVQLRLQNYVSGNQHLGVPNRENRVQLALLYLGNEHRASDTLKQS